MTASVVFLAAERRCIVLPVRYELIYVCYVEESKPALWSSGQSSWILRVPGLIPGGIRCSEK
jgi:hypothetical protein